MSIRAIRGATLLKENTKPEITEKTKEMLSNMMKENNVSVLDIVSIVFSATDDITACYPAAAARELGIESAGLLCVREMDAETGIPMCVRALMTVQSKTPQNGIFHIYLNGAEVLRPDLARKKFKSIAIDGPCGSGKSTVAGLLAAKLGYLHVDTGAMYRAVAYYCINAGIPLNDAESVSGILKEIDITLSREKGESQSIFLNGQNVTDLIRTQQVAEGSSHVAGIADVRKELVEIQRKIARHNDVVMDGRDIGSFVLKDADIKIYLDAGIDKRAKRRVQELLTMQANCDFETVKAEVHERDLRDMTREHSPLVKAEDAETVDTSDMSVEEVVEYIAGRVS